MGTQNFTLKLVAMALALSGGVLIAQTPRSESLSEVARSLEKRRSWVEWAFQERLDSLDREARLLDSRSSELFPWSVDFYLGSEIPAEPLRRRVNAPSGKLDEVALWTSAQKSLQVWMDSAGGRPSWGPQLRVILPIQAQSEAQSEGVFLLQAIPAPGPGRLVRMSWWNPHVVFSDILRQASSTEAKELAFLVDEKGQVLAHPQSSWVGTRIESLADSPLRQAQNLDQQEVWRSVGRIQGQAWRWVLERPKSQGFENTPGAAFLGWGGGLGLLLLSFVFLKRTDASRSGAGRVSNPEESDWTDSDAKITRGEGRVGEALSVAGAPTAGTSRTRNRPSVWASQPSMTVREDGVAGPVASAIGGKVLASGMPPEFPRMRPEDLQREMEQYRQALESERDKNEKVGRFEKECLALKDPRKVAFRLAQVAAELCKSPALILLQDIRLNSLVLAADAGFPEGHSPAGLSVSVDDSLLKRIETGFSSGELLGIQDHEPLTRVMMTRLGVAHFEAWAMAGFGPLGRASGKVRLLGAVVILQSSVESYSHREHLGRMIRAAGLVYENALLTSSGSGGRS